MYRWDCTCRGLHTGLGAAVGQASGRIRTDSSRQTIADIAVISLFQAISRSIRHVGRDLCICCAFRLIVEDYVSHGGKEIYRT